MTTRRIHVGVTEAATGIGRFVRWRGLSINQSNIQMSVNFPHVCIGGGQRADSTSIKYGEQTGDILPLLLKMQGRRAIKIKMPFLSVYWSIPPASHRPCSSHCPSVRACAFPRGVCLKCKVQASNICQERTWFVLGASGTTVAAVCCVHLSRRGKPLKAQPSPRHEVALYSPQRGRINPRYELQMPPFQ